MFACKLDTERSGVGSRSFGEGAKRADPKPKDVKTAFGIYNAVLCNLLKKCYYKPHINFTSNLFRDPSLVEKHSLTFFRLPRRKKVRLRGGCFNRAPVLNNISPLRSG